jgi:hypothetical protein
MLMFEEEGIVVLLSGKEPPDLDFWSMQSQWTRSQSISIFERAKERNYLGVLGIRVDDYVQIWRLSTQRLELVD